MKKQYKLIGTQNYLPVFIVLLLASSHSLFAQSTISGKVTAYETGDPVEQIKINNLEQNPGY
jgi:hypothetical protein